MTRRSDTAHTELPDAGKRSRTAPVCLAALILLLALFAPSAPGQSRQPTPAAGAEVVDYMVATVNGQLITYTDLLWQLALQPDAPLDRPRAEDLRRVLDLVIDQRIIYQEAEKLPHIHAADREVEPALAELVKRFSSQAEFQQRAERVGLTSDRVREIVRERVEIEKYISFRFRSFTVVTPQEVEGYYRDVYVPRYRRRAPGRIVPKLEEARAEIERTLTEDKIASDLANYFEDARAGAEIVMINAP